MDTEMNHVVLVIGMIVDMFVGHQCYPVNSEKFRKMINQIGR